MTNTYLATRKQTNSPSGIALAKARVSRHLSRRLPYYLTPEEAHQLIDAAGNERDRLFLRLLWETGVRVSEAVNIKLADVGRDGIRILGKGGVERVVFVHDGLVSAILFYALGKTQIGVNQVSIFVVESAYQKGGPDLQSVWQDRTG